jgi:hypothetical protein
MVHVLEIHLRQLVDQIALLHISKRLQYWQALMMVLLVKEFKRVRQLFLDLVSHVLQRRVGSNDKANACSLCTLG